MTRTSLALWAALSLALAMAMVGLTFFAPAGQAAAPVERPPIPSFSHAPDNSHVHEGVATCGGSGSSCHGRQAPTGLVVRQNEYATWNDRSSIAGRHSRAWAVLTEPRAEAIAARLGLGKAETADACLGCHTDHVAASQRGSPYYHVSDGVGCEACHGGSGQGPSDAGWLSTHYGVNGGHRDNVAHGMTALDDPKVRAAVCLDCHFGSGRPDQFVSHRLMSAGHPRIAFELDLFSELQRHYDTGRKGVDPSVDLTRGRQSPGAVKVWAVGQAMAMERALTLYSSPRGQDGAFPEFYFFDCQSCHRTISDDKAARPRFEMNAYRGIPSGMPPFNDENMIMLTAASRMLDAGLAARFDGEARAFHAALAKDRPTAIAAAQALRGTLSQMANAFSAHSFSRTETLTIAQAVVSDALSPRFTDFAGGAQAVMTIDTLLKDLEADGAFDGARLRALRPDLDRAYQAVSNPSQYDPAAFRASLSRIAAAVKAAR